MAKFTARCVLVGVLLWPVLGPLAAPAAADDTNILGLPAKAMEAKGTLLIAGGGSTPDEVYDEFVRLAGGKDARIVLIPSAYDYEGLEQIRRRFSGWFSYQVKSFQFLDTNSRETADSAEFVKPLLEATGVWFSGGDQSRLTERYLGTKVQAALHKILERGGIVGGTSAGAAVQSQVMLRWGWTEPELGDGLGLASRAVIDTHFSERGRHTRLIRALDQRPGYVGLGLDEGAALVVQGSHLKAIGRSTVTVCVSASEDQPIVLHRLKAGEQAELVKVDADKNAVTKPEKRDKAEKTDINTVALQRRQP
jgi:cyanophycinase